MAKTRACLTAQGARVTGGPVLPPQGPSSPAGELIVINAGAPTFIAFYKDSRTAKLFEPAAIQRAKRFNGQVERHSAVTIIWTHAPSGQLRRGVEGCAFS
jgi:hypothetical protein